MATVVTREYKNLGGVDFTNSEVQLNRSPDALNVWKNYKTLGKAIETRPSLELVKKVDNTIFGLFFYTDLSTDKKYMLIHSGASLKSYEIGTENEYVLKATGMNPRKSQSFIYGNKIYIKDGLNYLECTGTTCNEVIGYIPTTTTGKAPSGGGTAYEDVNLLSDYRKNLFVADGESTQYVLDAQEISDVTVKINGVSTTDFTVDGVNGKITFTAAPPKPLTDGQGNVEIQFKKVVNGNADKINKCTLLEVFDSRVFFSGNKNYPNTVFHSSLDYPNYVSDLDYYNEGMDMSPVRAMVSGNEALWVFKEPSQANTNVFYHTPMVDSVYGKVYPNSHSNIALGCIATAINFNDDICFFSNRGMEGITGDIQNENFVGHRSSLVDNKLLAESGYADMILAEWEGYLLIFIGNKVYLADSKAMWTNISHFEYEWFYWELEKEITCAIVEGGILYLCTKQGEEYGIYTLTGIADIVSYWTTPKDDFKYSNYQKVTNKKSVVIEVEGDDIELSTKSDGNEFNLISTYENTKGYIVPKIKLKKFRDMQLKIGSNKRFKLVSCTLEAFIGAYVKR